jgi:hypothetical protein
MLPAMAERCLGIADRLASRFAERGALVDSVVRPRSRPASLNHLPSENFQPGWWHLNTSIKRNWTLQPKY